MSGSAPHITIALCTFNGAPHLQAQLQSLLHQTHKNWSLWVSDDGSTDDTWTILEAFKRAHGDAHRIRLLRGPQQGLCRNFLSLLCHPDFPEGHVALADQDDIWLKGKLRRALRMMPDEQSAPLLYGAQSFHVAHNLRVLGRSKLPRKPPSFENALVQNVVSGHSMVLSPAALRVVRAFGAPTGVPFHDWWIYQVITGAGGRVILDTRPVLLYRQHETNAMGAPRGIAALGSRLCAIYKKTYKTWVTAHLEALWQRQAGLGPGARDTVNTFRSTPISKGAARASLFRRLGLKRQAGLETMGLYMAGILGWA